MYKQCVIEFANLSKELKHVKNKLVANINITVEMSLLMIA